MAELYFSPMANDYLSSIKDYIETELDNPKAAQNTIGKIVKNLRRLMNFPLSGTPLKSIVEIETDYRFVVSGNYISFYRYMDDIIFVDRILYARRDYLKILFGDFEN